MNKVNMKIIISLGDDESDGGRDSRKMTMMAVAACGGIS
jgi:hypothetical protein